MSEAGQAAATSVEQRPRVRPRDARGAARGGGPKAEAEAGPVPADPTRDRVPLPRDDAPARTGRRPKRRSSRDDGSVVRDVVRSPVFKDFMRTAAREIARGVFRTGRR